MSVWLFATLSLDIQTGGIAQMRNVLGFDGRNRIRQIALKKHRMNNLQRDTLVLKGLSTIKCIIMLLTMSDKIIIRNREKLEAERSLLPLQITLKIASRCTNDHFGIAC